MKKYLVRYNEQGSFNIFKRVITASSEDEALNKWFYIQEACKLDPPTVSLVGIEEIN